MAIKTELISFRLSSITKQLILERVKEFNMSISEYIRCVLTGFNPNVIQKISDTRINYEHVKYENPRQTDIPKGIRSNEINRKVSQNHQNFNTVMNELKEKFESGATLLRPIEVEVC